MLSAFGSSSCGLRNPHRAPLGSHLARRSFRAAALRPEEVLGIAEDEEDAAVIKTAYRQKLKEVHPDVYRGPGDPEALTKEVIAAYELLLEPRSSRRLPRRSASADPFSEPEAVAESIFVNELRCLGKSCYSSCVQKAPSVFSFAEAPFGAARASEEPPAPAAAYAASLAVGQCPRECIFYVTPLQRERLSAVLENVRDGLSSPGDADFALFQLLAKAQFENGRYRDPKERKRTPKSTSEHVDWF